MQPKVLLFYEPKICYFFCRRNDGKHSLLENSESEEWGWSEGANNRNQHVKQDEDYSDRYGNAIT